jgi:hypothetical protein
MRATFCAIGFIFFASTSLPGQSRTPASVTLLYRFDHFHSKIAFQEMKRELETVMKPLGYVPDWREVGNATVKDSFENLVMVDFRGRCLMEAADSPVQTNGALARTQVSDGTVLPFSEVECDQVRASLRSGWGTQPRQSDLALGRALGRVVAHELYHVLIRTTAHSSDGIEKKSLSETELVSDQLQFK